MYCEKINLNPINLIFLLIVSIFKLESCELKHRPLTFREELVVASAAGLAEIMPVGQICSYMNNQLTQVDHSTGKRLPISLNPWHWFRGMHVTAAAEVPIAMTQIMIDGRFRSWAENVQGCELSLKQSLACSALAGACSGLVATPTETIPLNMQRPENLVRNITAMQVIKELKFKGCYRGVGETVLRDAGFSAAYLTASQYARQRTRIHMLGAGFSACDKATKSAELVASAGVGLTIGLLTQPLVVIKNRKQGDPQARIYLNFKTTASAIWQREGARGLVRGFSVRGTRVMLAVPIMDYMKEFTTRKLVA